MTEKNLATIDDFLGEQRKKIAAAMPRACRPDRLIRIALAAINKTPKLRNCTRDSVLSCIMDLAQLGLEPDGRRAHLIPFEDRRNQRTICTLIVDYKGLIDLVMRSGKVAAIHLDVVGEEDDFSISHGTGGGLKHTPNLKGRGKIIGAYSYVRLKDGSESYDYMSRDEIEAVRQRSKAGQSGPWVTDWNEMGKKTVFRRHSKTLELSAESSELVQLAVERDYDTPIDISPEPSGKPIVEMPREKTQTAETPTDKPKVQPEPQSSELSPELSDLGDAIEEPPPIDEQKYYCSVCNAEITEKVNNYSVKLFKKPICYPCQKKGAK